MDIPTHCKLAVLENKIKNMRHNTRENKFHEIHAPSPFFISHAKTFEDIYETLPTLLCLKEDLPD